MLALRVAAGVAPGKEETVYTGGTWETVSETGGESSDTSDCTDCSGILNLSAGSTGDCSLIASDLVSTSF